MRKLIETLREYAEWADASIYDVPITLPNTLRRAADAIEDLSKPRWIPVTERLPEDFEPVYAALRSEGRENCVFEVEAYDPYLTCPWGHTPLIESGKAHVYAWMPRPLPEPPKEE